MIRKNKLKANNKFVLVDDITPTNTGSSSSSSGKVELVFNPHAANMAAIPAIVTSAATSTTTTTTESAISAPKTRLSPNSDSDSDSNSDIDTDSSSDNNDDNDDNDDVPSIPTITTNTVVEPVVLSTVGSIPTTTHSETTTTNTTNTVIEPIVVTNPASSSSTTPSDTTTTTNTTTTVADPVAVTTTASSSSSSSSNTQSDTATTNTTSTVAVTNTAHKIVPPFNVADMDKTKVSVINVAHYLAYGKPLYDGTGTYSSYLYGVGETNGYLLSRTKYEGFKEANQFPLRFDLYKQACDAIMDIDLSAFKNQTVRDSLNLKLKEIYAKTKGSHYVGHMLAWTSGFDQVVKDDEKARAWVQSIKQLLSTELIDGTTNGDLLNDNIDIAELLAFNARYDAKEKIKNKEDKIMAFIRGELKSNRLDTYLYHNIDPNFTSHLSFNGKHDMQTNMPKPTEFELSYLTYQSHDILRKPSTLPIINHLYTAQTLHRKVNEQVNKPATFVETELRCSLIKDMLLHGDPKSLYTAVKKSLETAFERTTDRAQYKLHEKDYASDALFFESLRLANVPEALRNALNFLLGNHDRNDCKNSGTAIQAILEGSLNISKELKALMVKNKPQTFDENLAHEFLDSMTAFVQNPKVVHAMNTWLNPEYVAPIQNDQKKNATTLTMTNT